MHFKTLIVTAATAGLAIAAPVAAATAASASTHPGVHKNATAACGFSCSNLFSEQLGSDSIAAVFVPNSNGMATKAKVGTKVDLKIGNDSFTNEDFVLTEDDTLGDACPTTTQTVPGLLSYYSYACIQLRNTNFDASFPVIESSWAPDGNQSGECPGVAAAHVAGELVTLQNCGVSANTLWVIDTNDAHVIGGTVYAPVVLGSDSNTSDPLVLTVNTGTKGPQNQLSVTRLDLLSHGFVPNQDMFSLTNGPAL